MADTTEEQTFNAVELATELTIAWLGNPNVRATAEDVPAFLKSMHATIGELGKAGDQAASDAAQQYSPAVPVRSSVKPDYLVSLIDGRKLKSLKRHLATHGLTPKDYRERYGLKADYPMVAANYAAQRRAVAQKIGLGSRGRAARQSGAEMAVDSSAGAAAKPAAKPAVATPKSPRKATSKTAKATPPAREQTIAAKRGRAKKAAAPTP